MRVGTSLGRLAFGRVTTEPEVQVILRPMTLFAGRVLLSAIFIMSGLNKLIDFSGSVAYLEAQQISPASVLIAIAAIAEIAGGLSVLTGTLARIGALILFLYLIPTTLIFHDFWTFAGMERQMQLVNFMKNLAIMGGLLAIVACGAGRFSVDRSIERKGPETI
jgi:putative oxidoreductase